MNCLLGATSTDVIEHDSCWWISRLLGFIAVAFCVDCNSIYLFDLAQSEHNECMDIV